MPDIKENRVESQKQGPKGQASSQGSPRVENGSAPAPRPAPPMSKAASPFAFMRRFVEEMDHLFEDFGLSHGLGSPRIVSRGRELLRREAGLIPADWSPRVDVVERDGLFVIRADLPGLSKDDVEVEIKGDLLTIQGERKQKTEEGRDGSYYSECAYGSFYRAVPLPEGVDVSKATAEFRDGVLELTMPAPRRPETLARRLEIQEKK
jgi:HSP20 family protein